MSLTGSPLVSVGLVGEVHLEAKNPLGLEVQDENGKVFVYLQGVANVVAGDWVSYDENGLCTLLDTAALALGPVAVATAAIVANRYGWFQRVGSVQANAGTVLDNGKVYATSTAGRCDDAAIAGAQVMGAIWRSTDATNLATVQLARPWIGATDAT